MSSWVYNITDQLTGYPYAAGAVFTLVGKVGPLGAVPSLVWGGIGGWIAGGISGDNDCAILKGIAASVGTNLALEAMQLN